MTDPIEPSTIEDWKAIAQAQTFLKEQYMDEIIRLRGRIYRLTHNSLGWKGALLIVIGRLLGRD